MLKIGPIYYTYFILLFVKCTLNFTSMYRPTKLYLRFALSNYVWHYDLIVLKISLEK